MSRAEHYQRAQGILAAVVEVGRGAERPRLTEADREALAVAQVHATLAAADSVAAGEAEDFTAQAERWVMDPLEVRLEAALEEVLTQADNRPVSAKWATAFIRERVLGGEARLQDRLKEALAELERQGRKATTSTEVASFIRQAVLKETGR